jgi:hypothetical protein
MDATMTRLKERTEADRYNVSAVERALDVLHAFTPQAPELSLTDVAAATKLHSDCSRRFATPA